MKRLTPLILILLTISFYSAYAAIEILTYEELMTTGGPCTVYIEAKTGDPSPMHMKDTLMDSTRWQWMVKDSNGNYRPSVHYQVYHLCGFTPLCRRIVPCACGKHRADHVLGVYHRQHSILCDWDHPCICLPGQPGFLQIYLSDYGFPEADELFFFASCKMRQGEVHLLREM